MYNEIKQAVIVLLVTTYLRRSRMSMPNFVRVALALITCALITACGGGGDSGGGDSGEGGVVPTPHTPDMAYSLGVGNANITRVGG